MKKHWDTIAVVGVGLIGGSISLGLRSRALCRQVIGITRREESRRRALQSGVVDQAVVDLAKGVKHAELVVVSTPVDTIVNLVQSVAAHCPEGAIITDAGSTKAEIVAALDGKALPRGVRFLGSHPLAGSEQSGPEHAAADLFVGRKVIVTPGEKTEASDLARLHEFWSALGAEVVEMTPTDHDRVLAAVSHLPHLVATSLAASTAERDLPLAGSGWQDTTRIAAGDPALWRAIFESNCDSVLESLSQFENRLAKARRAITEGDWQTLEELLKEANRILNLKQGDLKQGDLKHGE